MKRFESIKEFEDFSKIILDDSENEQPRIVICAGTSCQTSGANDLIRIIKKNIIEKNLHERISLRITGCLGNCEIGPFIIVEPEDIVYPKLKMDDVPEVIDAIINGKVVEDKLYYDTNTNKRYKTLEEIPFFKYQTRTIIGKNRKIDPIRIHDYICTGGYSAIIKVLSNPDSSRIIDEVTKSELRGRGGAGFPTGKKWALAKTSGNGTKQKYLVCNADEGDPGAYMDRSVLEGNPNSVIEGMIIGAIAIGATQGFVYVRTEYPLAIKHLTIALRQANEYGLLGKNIMGTGIDFDISIIKGAGAFVCGEESALIRSIEGKIGRPRQRPPFPVEKGIWGYPTCINNVETFANIPVIINEGAEEYIKVGVPGNRGTKIFSLVGKIQNTGLVEVPLGTEIKKVVYDIGGGHPEGKKIKAIQTGGPSGGCIPEKLFDLPIDYESLSEAGSMMGSGGMIVMDENTCMVDVARYFTNFLQEESCGKCSICREGTQRMFEMLTNITEGKGTMEDLQLLEELGSVIKDTSMCGLGQTASNPLLSTLKYFLHEYHDHIIRKRCTAGVCKEIISSPCQYTCPIGTEAAVYIAHIANGKYKEALETIKKDNPLASVVARVCHHPCEKKCKAKDGGDAIAIRNLKRFVTDFGLKNKLFLKAEPPKQKNKIKVAVIGSGPSGLTCGFYLAEKGYDVTIFEKHAVIGGMLALGIPEYRLPRKILETDLDYIKSIGIDIQTNKALGKDFNLDKLFKEGYNAVYIATGAYKSINLDIPGEDAEGVLHGIKALIDINLGKEVEIGKKVGIIGGGNSAVDAARCILRSGKSDSVTIFYRRTIEEMPAFRDEVEAALEEGIKIEFLTAPDKIITDKGKIKACEFIRMELGEPDDSGRRRPVPVKGSEFTVNIDTLVVSISEQPDTSFLQNEGVEFTKWGTIKVDEETYAAKRQGVFAGGDLVTGPNTVVDAMAAGIIASESIHQYLTGKEIKREYKLTRPSVYLEPIELTEEEKEELSEAKRPGMKRLFAKERECNFNEVEKGLTEKQAMAEAKRCLRCDLLTKEGREFVEKVKAVSEKI